MVLLIQLHVYYFTCSDTSPPTRNIGEGYTFVTQLSATIHRLSKYIGGGGLHLCLLVFHLFIRTKKRKGLAILLHGE